ncbi:MAG: outer membrane lipoprotein-sorting protein [Deltaproteobacteria bacterium]|nr:outer membrane lipoprotein-sorting protein [Deltaproteobacteria bacterium]MBI3294043.1 outer membrane lipoprotein-sorting protein [Deltaproteobacteria bacterium]
MKKLLTMLCVSLSAWAAGPSGDDLVKRADEARFPSGAVSFSVKVTDKTESSEKETLYRVDTKDGDLSLVTTQAPPRLKGRKLLMRENDLWLYLPSIERPTRVSAQQRLTGEVANGDIAHTAFARDYSAEVKGISVIDKELCFELLLTARNKGVTYHSIRYWIQKRNNYPVKAEFYALSGKALKTGVYSHFQPVLGRPRMTQLVITDALKPTHQSILLYSDFKTESFDDRHFSKDRLG